MKKYLAYGLVLLGLILALTLQTDAAQYECQHLPADYYETITDYKEYLRAIAEMDVDAEFITYEDIAELGEFRSFQVAHNFWSINAVQEVYHCVPRYFYTLRDDNGFFFHVEVAANTLSCSCEPETTDDGIIIYPPERYDPYDLAWNDVSTTLKGMCLHGRLGAAVTEDLRVLCNEWQENGKLCLHGTLQAGKNGAIYQYSEGKLESIYFNVAYCVIKIHGTKDLPLSAYPGGEDTVLLRLLDSTLAAKTAGALQGNILDSSQPKSTLLTTVIAMGFAAATAWGITYFVMRKKAKNPPRLAGNGEIPASADEITPTPAENAPDGAPDTTQTDHNST